MKLFFYPLLVLILICIRSHAKCSSDSTKPSLYDARLIYMVQQKSSKFLERIESINRKYLQQLEREDRRLDRTLAHKDSSLMSADFPDGLRLYDVKLKEINERGSKIMEKSQNVYNGYLDTIRTALAFINAKGTEFSTNNPTLDAALGKLNEVQVKLNQTEALKKLIEERRAFLSDRLNSVGMSKELLTFNRYLKKYSAAVNFYKEQFKKPAHVEKRLLEYLLHERAFGKFFAKHSQLASMFNFGGQSSTPDATIPGLQTRQLLQQEAMQRLGNGADPSSNLRPQATAAQASLTDVQTKLDNLKAKGQGVPAGTPGIASTGKTFFKRLKYGTNLQNSTPNTFFPATTDFSLTVAYRFNQKIQAGVGAGGKVGWGKDIQHLSVTGQGASLKSFFEFKLKGGLNAFGGYEYHYNRLFTGLGHIRNLREWSPSGLVGITRNIPVRSRFFAANKMMVLWDFLSYQQTPARQPLVVRIGYDFK